MQYFQVWIYVARAAARLEKRISFKWDRSFIGKLLIRKKDIDFRHVYSVSQITENSKPSLCKTNWINIWINEKLL